MVGKKNEKLRGWELNVELIMILRKEDKSCH